MNKERVTWFIFIIFASLSMVSAQSSDKITAEFKARHQAQDEAENKKDIPALDRIFADDFMFIGANGSITDKKKFFADLKADTSPPSDQKLEYEDFKVRVYGKTALAGYVLVVPGKDSQGKDTVSRYRMSVLWVKQGKDWRITNFHATRVRP